RPEASGPIGRSAGQRGARRPRLPLFGRRITGCAEVEIGRSVGLAGGADGPTSTMAAGRGTGALFRGGPFALAVYALLLRGRGQPVGVLRFGIEHGARLAR